MTLREYAGRLRKIAKSYGLLVKEPSHNVGDLIRVLKVADASNLILPIIKMMNQGHCVTMSTWVEPFLNHLDTRADQQAAEILLDVTLP